MLKTSSVQIATTIQPAIRSQRARDSPFSSSKIRAPAGSSWATVVTASECVVGAATARKDARPGRRTTLTPRAELIPSVAIPSVG
jgi:hypothetical protein